MVEVRASGAYEASRCGLMQGRGAKLALARQARIMCRSASSRPAFSAASVGQSSCMSSARQRRLADRRAFYSWFVPTGSLRAHHGWAQGEIADVLECRRRIGPCRPAEIPSSTTSQADRAPFRRPTCFAMRAAT